MGIRTHTMWVLMKMSMEDGCLASGGGPEVSWASRTHSQGETLGMKWGDQRQTKTHEDKLKPTSISHHLCLSLFRLL